MGEFWIHTSAISATAAAVATATSSVSSAATSIATAAAAKASATAAPIYNSNYPSCTRLRTAFYKAKYKYVC